MNAETAGKKGRIALLYIGLVVVILYGAILIGAPVCIWKLYRMNAKLSARIVVLEAKAKGVPAPQARPADLAFSPVVLNFYGTAELVPRGQRPKTKTY